MYLTQGLHRSLQRHPGKTAFVHVDGQCERRHTFADLVDTGFEALIGRHLDVYGDPGFGPQVQGGKARLLATFTSQRLKRFPDVPTIKELGYDLVIDSPVGLVAPKNLDARIAARLQAAFRKAASDPAYLQQLESFDMQANAISGEAYADYARAQFARDQKMLAEIGFKPE